MPRCTRSANLQQPQNPAVALPGAGAHYRAIGLRNADASATLASSPAPAHFRCLLKHWPTRTDPWNNLLGCNSDPFILYDTGAVPFRECGHQYVLLELVPAIRQVCCAIQAVMAISAAAIVRSTAPPEVPLHRCR